MTNTQIARNVRHPFRTSTVTPPDRQTYNPNAIRFDLDTPIAKALRAEALHGVFCRQIRHTYKHFAPTGAHDSFNKTGHSRDYDLELIRK